MSERRRQEEIARRPLLDPKKKETMLMVLIRQEGAFLQAKAMLTPKEMEAMGRCYAVLWRAALEFHARRNCLPTQALLRDEIQQAVAAQPDLLQDEELTELDTFLDTAYDDVHHGCQLEQSRMHRDEALDSLRMFLEEALSHDLTNVVHQHGTRPSDLPMILRSASDKMSALAGLTGNQAVDDQVFLEGWDSEEAPPLRSTGINFLDTFLGGGDLPTEVNVFMGPLGSCKTLLACYGVGCAIKQANWLYRNGLTDGRIPKVVYITTETLKTEFRLRVLASMAQIPFDRLASTRLKDLSDAPEPGAVPATHYELQYFNGAGRSKWLPEIDRARAAVNIANSHLLFIDFTGTTNDARSSGQGGIVELAGVVQNKLAEYKALGSESYPYTFWLDHAAALATRMMTSGKYHRDDRRHLLKDMPLQCRDLLAGPYNTPMWIFHQLSGDANSRGCTAEIDHTDSDECKQFAMYANFAIVCGKPNDEQLAKFKCTKHRRQPPSLHRIVRIHGQIMRVEDVSETHTISGRSIVLRHDQQAMIAMSAAPVVGRQQRQITGLAGENEGAADVSDETPAAL